MEESILVRLVFDANVAEAMHYSKSSADAAARLLLIAAKCLRANEEMPTELRLYLADAFERSMGKSKAYRNNALLRELRLKSSGRRKVKTPWLNHPGEALQEMLYGGASQNAAASEVAVDYGISEATAVRLWKEWRAEKDAYDQFCLEEFMNSHPEDFE